MFRDIVETCEGPFGILLVSSVVQVPQKFLHFPWTQVLERDAITFVRRLLTG